jgi:hypothetical protein
MAINKMAVALKRLLSFPNDLLFYLTRDGDWKLRFPTDIIIDHFVANLGAMDAEKIRSQLSQPLVQHWWHKGLINPIFHYQLDPDSLLEGQDYEDGLFRVEMFVDGKKQRANITFITGRLYSVELPKPIKFYEGKSLTFGTITSGKSNQSTTRIIDRLEHGKDEASE